MRGTVILILGIITFSTLAGGMYMYSRIDNEGEPGKITIVLDFDSIKENKTYVISIEGNKTFFEIMNENFEIEFESYGSLGHLITGIERVYSNVNITQYYWIYYINGEKSKMGTDIFYPSSGDFIEWKYEPFSA